jgi:membrane-associated phospholipid phosphatase
LKFFLKNNLLILLSCTIAVCTALYFVFTVDKKVIHLFSNQFVGNTWIDGFFYYITTLGDGTMAVIILIILLFYNFRLGLYTTASFLTASLASIGLKEFFFDDVNRPSFIFNYYEHYQLKLVDGVHVYIHNSFPSGHATQAFAIFMCLAFVSQKQILKFLCLALALLTAYSRVHLSQHWLIDITVGSLLGTFFSLLYYYVFMANTKFDRLNKSILLFIRFWRSR